MSGNEFFYIDADGKKQDAALHDAILDAGDHHAATEVGKEVARRAGISEDMILKLYAEPVLAAGNEDSARQIGIEAARRAGLLPNCTHPWTARPIQIKSQSDANRRLHSEITAQKLRLI
jgi:hypothetical protein